MSTLRDAPPLETIICLVEEGAEVAAGAVVREGRQLGATACTKGDATRTAAEVPEGAERRNIGCSDAFGETERGILPPEGRTVEVV